MLNPAAASHSLGEMLGLGRVTAREVYTALVNPGARGYKNKLGNNPMRRPTKGISE